MPGPLESKYVAVEGVRLHYQEIGSGSPLICIHGAGPGASAESNFKLNAAPFAEKFRVILYDMPQYGKSDKIVDSDSADWIQGRRTRVRRPFCFRLVAWAG